MEKLLALNKLGWEVNCFFRKNRIEVSARTGEASYAVFCGTELGLLASQLAKALENRKPYQREQTKPAEISFEFLFGQTHR